MGIIKQELHSEVVKFFKEYGHLIILNNETYVYMGHPWFKLDVGSNIAEVYWNKKDFPEDLKKALEDD